MASGHQLSIGINAKFDPSGFRKAKQAIQQLKALAGMGGVGGRAGKGYLQRMGVPKVSNVGSDPLIRQLSRREKAMKSHAQFMDKQNKNIGREIEKNNKKISGVTGKQIPTVKMSGYVKDVYETKKGQENARKNIANRNFPNVKGYIEAQKNKPISNMRYNNLGQYSKQPFSHYQQSAINKGNMDLKREQDKLNSRLKGWSNSVEKVDKSTKQIDNNLKSSRARLGYSYVMGRADGNLGRMGSSPLGVNMASSRASTPQSQPYAPSGIRGMFSFPKDTGSFGIMRSFYDFGVANIAFTAMNKLMGDFYSAFKAKSELPTNLKLMTQIPDSTMTESEIAPLMQWVDKEVPSIAPKLNKYEVADVLTETGIMYGLSAENMKQAITSATPLIGRFHKEGRTTRDAILAFRDMFEGEFIRAREVGINKGVLKDWGFDFSTNDFSQEAFMRFSKAIEFGSHQRGWDALLTKVESFDDMMNFSIARVGEAGANAMSLAEGKIASAFNLGLDVLGPAWGGIDWAQSQKILGSNTTVGNVASSMIGTTVLGIAGSVLVGKTLAGLPEMFKNFAHATGRGRQYDEVMKSHQFYGAGGWSMERTGKHDKKYAIMKQNVDVLDERMKRKKDIEKFDKRGRLRSAMHGQFTRPNELNESNFVTERGSDGKTRTSLVKPVGFKETLGKMGRGAYNVLGGPIGMAFAGLGIGEAVYSLIKDNTQLLDTPEEKMIKGLSYEQNRLSSTTSGLSHIKDLISALESNKETYKEGTSAYKNIESRISGLKRAETAMENSKRIVEAKISYNIAGLSGLTQNPIIDSDGTLYFEDPNEKGKFIKKDGSPYNPKKKPFEYTNPDTGETSYGKTGKEEKAFKDLNERREGDPKKSLLGTVDVNDPRTINRMVSLGWLVQNDEEYAKKLNMITDSGKRGALVTKYLKDYSEELSKDNPNPQLLKQYSQDMFKQSGGIISTSRLSSLTPAEQKSFLSAVSTRFDNPEKHDEMYGWDPYLRLKRENRWKGDFNEFAEYPLGKMYSNKYFSAGMNLLDFGVQLSSLGLFTENPIRTLLESSALFTLGNGSKEYTGLPQAITGFFDFFGQVPGTNRGVSDGANQTTQTSSGVGTPAMVASSTTFAGTIEGTAKAVGSMFDGSVSGEALSFGNMFSGLINGDAFSASNPFTGFIEGLANSTGQPFTGNVGGLAKFFGPFSGTVTGNVVVNGIISAFGGKKKSPSPPGISAGGDEGWGNPYNSKDTLIESKTKTVEPINRGTVQSVGSSLSKNVIFNGEINVKISNPKINDSKDVEGLGESLGDRMAEVFMEKVNKLN